jgi:hypothetical protein
MMNGCTIVARNYLAQASALADSFVEANREGVFTIFVIDIGEDRIESDDPRVRVVGPEGAGFERAEFHRMAAIYDVIELATAVKPTLLRHLLAEGGEPVTYLDPDILVFEPLDEIERLARADDIVLTPHTSVPLPDDGHPPGEVAFLEAGVFNLGFVAVGPGAVPFLDWWAERLSRRCLVATHEHLFVDQKWIDLVPCYFRHHVLRDPAVNVAYWNLPVRTLERRGDAWRVDGRPLVFFHFSGYDPAKPHLLSKFQGGDPRIRLDEHPDLRAICDMYAARLEQRGHATLRRSAYGYAALPGGMPLDARTRAVYRRTLVACEAAGADLPPNPFDPGGEAAFLDWLSSPAGDPADWGALSVLAASAWLAEPGLRDAFPAVPGHDAGRLLEWLEEGGARQLGMATWLCRGRAGGAEAVPAPLG